MTDTSVNDIFGDAAATPSDLLRGLAARAVEIKDEIEGLEAIVSERKRELQDITHKRMIDAMAECGVSEMKLPDGAKFKIMQFVSGSLPKGDTDDGKVAREAAIAWLEEHGHTGMLKTEVSVQFDKSGHNMAIDLQQSLIEQGMPAQLESGVHAATYQSWAREALKAGEELPLEVLGLNAGQYVKMTMPKEKL